MVRFLFIYVFLTTALLPNFVYSQAINNFFQEADLFFKKHVVNEKVDYRLIGQDMEGLNEIMAMIESIDADQLEEPDRKAYLINVYNLAVIKQIMDNYPLTSTEQVNGFFTLTKFQVGGKSYTLNAIENDILRPTYKDPRLHFVLVCGALGCPPIIEGAYLPSILDEQLDQQTKKAMNNPYFTRVQSYKETLQLSQIFEWYKKDFKENDPSVIAFINRYREHKIPDNYKIAYYDYDWTLNSLIPPTGAAIGQPDVEGERLSNVQAYTPSVLLKPNQIEVKHFSNLYSQDHWFNPDGEKTPLASRQTFYTGTFSVLYGVSQSSRINAGFDLNIKSAFYDPDSSASPLKTFAFELTDTSRTVLSSFGPKIKFSPFASIQRFSIQSAFWIPVAPHLEGTPWIDYDRYIWWNQFFYDKSFFNRKIQIFTEIDLLFRLAKDQNKSHQLVMPASVFTSYFPNGRTTLYAMFQASPTMEEKSEARGDGTVVYRHQLDSKWGHQGHFFQTGVGGKYQLTPSFEVELLYTNFIAGNTAGAGYTANIGVRYLR